VPMYFQGIGRFVPHCGPHKSRFGSGPKQRLGKNGPLGSSFHRALVRARLAALGLLARRHNAPNSEIGTFRRLSNELRRQRFNDVAVRSLARIPDRFS
jgi:hypothetical protein